MEENLKEIINYLGNDKNYNCDCNDGSYYLELPYREAQELKDCIINLQQESKEIERLKKENKRLTSLCVGHEKELRTKDIIIKQIRMEEADKLNNIINGLEKDLEDIFYGRGQHSMDSSIVPIKYVLDKLKELKEVK